MPVLTGNAEKVAGYLHKSARMMGIGLKVAATWNCVAGTARLFGAPVPKVPGAWTDRLEKAQKVVKDLHLTSSAAVAEQEEAADAGMNRKELEDFAECLASLESQGDPPRWKKELYPIQDPSPSARGRVAYTTVDRAGTFGGKEQKAAIEKYVFSVKAADAEVPAKQDTEDTEDQHHAVADASKGAAMITFKFRTDGLDAKIGLANRTHTSCSREMAKISSELRPSCAT